jgi:hypothetical protein
MRLKLKVIAQIVRHHCIGYEDASEHVRVTFTALTLFPFPV